jgi:hypothetical protein
MMGGLDLIGTRKWHLLNVTKWETKVELLLCCSLFWQPWLTTTNFANYLLKIEGIKCDTPFLQKETKRIDDIFDFLKMSERNIVSICQLERKQVMTIFPTGRKIVKFHVTSLTWISRIYLYQNSQDSQSVFIRDSILKASVFGVLVDNVQFARKKEKY